MLAKKVQALSNHPETMDKRLPLARKNKELLLKTADKEPLLANRQRSTTNNKKPKDYCLKKQTKNHH